MTAVRLARASTGRSKLLVFDGCYHGHGDTLMAGKTAGIPASVAGDVRRVPFNDPGAFEAAIRREGQAIACVIMEPVAANMGVVLPEPDYLDLIRRRTQEYGILLILDEVVTGFRLGYGGAQERFGIQPDLTTFGKIIGGGLPAGALGGPRRLMQRLAPEGNVYHGGTFAGHPLSMIAGIATLRALKAQPPYARLERMTRRLADGLLREAQSAGVAARINQIGSMTTVFFSEGLVRSYTDAAATRRDRFAAWAVALRRKGIVVPPSPFEAFFLSSAHRDTDVDRVLDAARTAFQAAGAVR